MQSMLQKTLCGNQMYQISLSHQFPKMDIANLIIGSVQNLFFEMETRPQTEQFKPH